MSKKVTTNTFVPDSDVAICAQNLNFTYNPRTAFEKHALCNVNLTVKRGEFVAVIGQTGSGKTTFVQHLNALIRVQSGNLWVLGQDLSAKKVDLKQLRHNVGMVFQYPEQQLFADTVLDDVCFGLKNFGTDQSQWENLAREALQLVGMDYENVKGKSPFDLSGGEKRRVALAGVLVTKPQVLVMDEPTAGLDPRGKSEILDLVTKLNREYGVTVIVVSHDMNEVYEHASRVVVFNNGSIAYDQPTQQLFANEQAITEMNLEVPQMAQITNILRNSGMGVSDSARTVEEVFAEICRLFKGGDGHVS